MRVQRVRPLAASDVPRLPSWTGRECVLDAASDGPDAWTHAAIDRYGFCGVVMQENGRSVGWLLICPSLNVPNGHGLDQAPRLADVAMVLGISVHPDHRKQGVGRALVRHTCARLVDKASGMECLGALGVPTCEAPPRGFLANVGFHPVGPAGVASLSAPVRMRLDLDTTVLPPRRNVHTVIQTLTGWVHAPAPGPAVRSLADHDHR